MTIELTLIALYLVPLVLIQFLIMSTGGYSKVGTQDWIVMFVPVANSIYALGGIILVAIHVYLYSRSKYQSANELKIKQTNAFIPSGMSPAEYRKEESTSNTEA